MNRPFFSCVIPVKGERPYFDTALESLRSQGIGDELEIIVQDGDVEPDSGQSDALNKGFAKAKGGWFFWLNADDVLLPGALKKIKTLTVEAGDDCRGGRLSGCQIARLSDCCSRARGVTAQSDNQTNNQSDNVLLNSPVNWIAGDTVYINENGLVQEVRTDAKWRPWFVKRLSVWTGGPSAFFRRELWEKRGGFDVSLKYAMDIDLWTRWAKAGERFVGLGDYVWGFRVHDGSKTMGGKNHDEHRAERTYLMCKHGIRRELYWRNLTRIASVFDGSWMKRKIDSVRMRGRKYNMVAE